MAITAIGTASPALNGYPPPLTATYTATRKAISADIDVQDGGNYRIVGTVKEKGTPNTPVFRRVLLCDQLSGRVVRSTWSDAATGAYAFNYIRMGTFYVLSFDHTGALRAVVADGQIPELIP